MDVDLAESIRGWDGKSVDAIKRIHDRFAKQPDYLERLVHLAADPDLETGATWLLKHYLEQTKQPLGPDLSARFAALASGLGGWEARLHSLQIVPRLILAEPQAVEALLRFALDCRADANKFVRAWAYSAMYLLALEHPVPRAEVRAILQEAANTEQAASAKVRLRRALEQGFPA